MLWIKRGEWRKGNLGSERLCLCIPQRSGWKQKHLPKSTRYWRFLICAVGETLCSCRMRKQLSNVMTAAVEMTFGNSGLFLISRSLPFFGPQFPIWTLRGSIKVAPGHGKFSDLCPVSFYTVSTSLPLPTAWAWNECAPLFLPHLWEFSCPKMLYTDLWI